MERRRVISTAYKAVVYIRRRRLSILEAIVQDQTNSNTLQHAPSAKGRSLGINIILHLHYCEIIPGAAMPTRPEINGRCDTETNKGTFPFLMYEKITCVESLGNRSDRLVSGKAVCQLQG
jgi:hypothetical protein